MCITRSLPNNFSFMFFNIFLDLKINKKEETFGLVIINYEYFHLFCLKYKR